MRNPTRGLFAVAATALLAGCASVSTVNETVTEEWVFGAPTRTVIDNGPTQQSVGDVTITTGSVQSVDGEEQVGSYSTNQVTVLVDSQTNDETRRVDVSMSVPAGEVFAKGVIVATPGQPPTERQTFAITGGTGDYSGVAGTFTHEGIEGRPDFGVTLELLDRE